MKERYELVNAVRSIFKWHIGDLQDGGYLNSGRTICGNESGFKTKSIKDINKVNLCGRCKRIAKSRGIKLMENKREG